MNALDATWNRMVEAACAAWHETTRRTSWADYSAKHPVGAATLRRRMAVAMSAGFEQGGIE